MFLLEQRHREEEPALVFCTQILNVFSPIPFLVLIPPTLSQTSAPQMALLRLHSAQAPSHCDTSPGSACLSGPQHNMCPHQPLSLMGDPSHVVIPPGQHLFLWSIFLWLFPIFWSPRLSAQYHFFNHLSTCHHTLVTKLHGPPLLGPRVSPLLRTLHYSHHHCSQSSSSGTAYRHTSETLWVQFQTTATKQILQYSKLTCFFFFLVSQCI